MLVHLIPLILLIHGAQSGRYDYGIFENFELTKDIFIDEIELVKHLQNVRSLLKERAKVIRSHMEQHKQSLLPMNETLDVVQHPIPAVRLLARSFFQKNLLMDNLVKTKLPVLKPLPKIEGSLEDPARVLVGATKGLVMLQETYNIDLRKFIKGQFPTRTGPEQTSRNGDQLWVGTAKKW